MFSSGNLQRFIQQSISLYVLYDLYEYMVLSGNLQRFIQQSQRRLRPRPRAPARLEAPALPHLPARSARVSG